MPWPRSIKLVDSEFSHAYDGSDVRETWYIEPFDAADAFISSMLGRWDNPSIQPGNEPRTLPASHFRYTWCLAVEAVGVPLDKRQFSFMGPANLGGAANGIPGNITRVQTAVQTYGAAGAREAAGALRPNADNDFVGVANQNFSPGAFVCVTYHPILIPGSISPGQAPTASIMDFVNYAYVPKFRKNIPNAGLKLITPPNPINLFGAFGAFYPAAGIAPELSEEYQELVIERRMLNPNFDLTALAGFLNYVDSQAATLPNGKSFSAETLRFSRLKTQFVQVPIVNAAGEPDGYSRWLNLELGWDWRTLQSPTVYNKDASHGYIVTWNHVLAYPGTLAWLVGGGGLAWYYCKFSANNFGVDAPPYPVLPGGVTILDPLTKNF
jgi:hypothetical protein